MNVLKSFNIPIKGALLGQHEYEFIVDDEFFSAFEYKPFDKGNFKVNLLMDKRPNLLDLEFIIEGNFSAPCDRCLAEIQIPIFSERRILVKFDDLGKEDTDEVIYINSEESHLQVAGLIFELISLSIPISKTLDCDNNDYQFCDKEVLAKYDEIDDELTKAEEEEQEDKLAIWDKLKDIKLN